MSALQLSLLAPAAAEPAGFRYRPELIAADEEGALLAQVVVLPFREFEFHGFLGKRRVVSYGMRYDFADGRLHEAEPIPEFLLPLLEQSAAFAAIDPAALEHALVTEYQPGAAIGWHRDRRQFGDIIGISLLSPCRFRFRRRISATHPRPAGRVEVRSGWERRALTLEPRSAYLLHGGARHEWEHSIPPAEALRYSVTFRTMRA